MIIVGPLEFRSTCVSGVGIMVRGLVCRCTHPEPAFAALCLILFVWDNLLLVFRIEDTGAVRSICLKLCAWVTGCQSGTKQSHTHYVCCTLYGRSCHPDFSTTVQ
jgi:hypothetical protein